MSVNPTATLILVLLFVVVFVFGFVLQRRGRPHNVLLLTAHKLIALAALVLMTVTVIRVNRTAPLGTVALVAAASTGVFFVVAIISGGLLSTDKALPPAVKALHRISPFLTVLAATLTLIRLP